MLDETDEEGIIIAADWEKAFDRVSWDYLHKAVRSLGFGEKMQRWIAMLYNHNYPPIRNTKVNGLKSRTFEMHSGVPQGCPASPLIFLLVAEALTRAIESDTRIKGIAIDANTERRITQFADDTQFLLRGYKYLKFIWPVLDEYEAATGMRANTNKFEGLRCGRLKRKPVPLIPELGTQRIRWVKDDQYIRILGIPFWENFDVNLFWEEKYQRAKKAANAWNKYGLTLLGKGMIINSMFVGRFRYYVQAMAMPEKYIKAIDQDIQALTWAKEDMEAESLGSDPIRRRAMVKTAQHLPRKECLGANVPSWASHVKALQSHWILRYLDATRGAWKAALDCWFAREVEDRGAIATTIPLEHLFRSTTYRRPALPRFWREASRAFKELELTPIQDISSMGRETIRAMPVWSNPLFSIRPGPYDTIWREVLDLRRLGDFVNADQKPWSDAELRLYFEQNLTLVQTTKGDTYKIKGKTVPEENLLQDWRRIVQAIPRTIMNRVFREKKYYGFSDKAVSMMRKMGWTDSCCLGKRKYGRQTPIPPAQPSRQPNAGVGFSKLRKQFKREDKARALITPNGSRLFGYPQDHYG